MAALRVDGFLGYGLRGVSSTITFTFVVGATVLLLLLLLSLLLLVEGADSVIIVRPALFPAFSSVGSLLWLDWAFRRCCSMG